VIKTFSIGILSGIALAAGLLYLVPAVDQHREASMISVLPNVGNAETFHINLPEDQILGSLSSTGEPIPRGLKWPQESGLADAQTGLYKLRNRNDIVVGVASRVTTAAAGNANAVEWTLHLPARGSIYATLQPAGDASDVHTGSMLAGTHEFANLQGSVRERFLDAMDETGRIELVAALTGRLEETP
jgi:hypothetical protein